MSASREKSPRSPKGETSGGGSRRQMDTGDASTAGGSKDRNGVDINFDYSKLNFPSNNFIFVPSGRAPFLMALTTPLGGTR